MRYLTPLATLLSLTAAAPLQQRDTFSFPTPDGFPTPSPDQLRAINKQAFGTLSNATPPPKISTDGLTSLKLVAFNELFEVAFFTELVKNLTDKVPGYDLGTGHKFVLESIEAVLAQEKLHQLNANNALKRSGLPIIEPCKYDFPVSDFRSAIALAATFTDVVLGVLQDVIQIFAKNGDDGLARGTAASLGNEGEQEGFYRVLQNKRPSALPFLTTNVRDFAFTAIQGFVVPGSCPNINTIALKTFKPLNLLDSNIKPATQNLHFSFKKSDAGTEDWSSLSVAYINQQNKPVTKQLGNVVVSGETVTFEAAFPFDEFLMNGLTVAAVVKGTGDFANAAAVAQAAILGPALIEVNPA